MSDEESPSTIIIQHLRERLKTTEEKCREEKRGWEEETKGCQRAEKAPNRVQTELDEAQKTVKDLEQVKEQVVGDKRRLEDEYEELKKEHSSHLEGHRKLSDDFRKTKLDVVHPLVLRALIDKARGVIVTECGTGSWEGFKETYLVISGESGRYSKAPDMIQHSHLSDFKSSGKAWRKICLSRGLRYAGNRAAHLTDDNVRIWEAILEC